MYDIYEKMILYSYYDNISALRVSLSHSMYNCDCSGPLQVCSVCTLQSVSIIVCKLWRWLLLTILHDLTSLHPLFLRNDSYTCTSLESRPSPFRDRFTHAHINGRVYGKIRRGKERAWDTSPESWVMFLT